MREIVLDTETTGLDPETGDRIVEIGGVELVGHVPTGRTFHQYINPERAMPLEAFEVHGLGDEFLADKPKFAEIGQVFLDFIGDARLVIHNASFDMKFLNAELRWMRLPLIPDDRAVDTLMIARRKYPGSPASLDALCRRFAIDNSARTLHGALLDSRNSSGGLSGADRGQTTGLRARSDRHVPAGRQPAVLVCPAPSGAAPAAHIRRRAHCACGLH